MMTAIVSPAAILFAADFPGANNVPEEIIGPTMVGGWDLFRC